MRSLLWLFVFLYSFPVALARPVSYRWANVNPQSLIGWPNESKTIVAAEGALLDPRTRLDLLIGPEARPLGQAAGLSQKLLDGYLPVVVTQGERKGISYRWTAFCTLEKGRPLDVVRIEAVNLTQENKAIAVQGHYQGLLEHPSWEGRSLRDEGKLLLTGYAEAGWHVSGKSYENTWGCVSGWSPQKGWAHPPVPSDPAFRSIHAGWGGKPIVYRFRAKSGHKYWVAFGLCEGFWNQSGQRVLDLKIDGKTVRTLDTVADIGKDRPWVELFPAIASSEYIEVASVASSKAKDRNSILNVLWVFDEATTPRPEDVIAGQDIKPLYKADCGGEEDQEWTRYMLSFEGRVGPGERRAGWLAVPRGVIQDLDARHGAQWLARTRRWWDRFFARAARFEVPDRDVVDFYRASLAYLLLLRERVGDFYVVKPGASLYNAFWYRDGAYICRAYDIAGLPDEAERALRVFIHTPLPREVDAHGTARIEQREDGAWTAPEGEWDGQGQALWAILSHYELTHDRRWLAMAYPAIRKGAEWIHRIRKTTKRPEDEGSGHWGLFPRGEGEAILSNEYCFYHDFWGILGIRKAARAAEALGKVSDAAWMWQEYEDFLRCVRRAVAQSFVRKSDGKAYIPAAPGRPDARIWGGIAALYPCEVYPPDDPAIVATLKAMWDWHVEDVYRFIDWDNKIWTYITADWAQAYLLSGDREKVTRLFGGYLEHAYPTKSWVEEMFVDTHLGTGDQPHGWAAANYILLLRNMLLLDTDKGLKLLAGVPPEWLEQSGIRIDRAPTCLGTVSFSAQLLGKRLELNLDMAAASDKRIVVDLGMLPWEIAGLEVRHGRVLAAREKTLEIAAGPTRVRVRFR